MENDRRGDAARYYDLYPFADDLPFYEARLPSPHAAVLELGCGTGRVLVPLSRRCAYICGIELSESMLAICHDKLAAASLAPEQAQAVRGDICDFDLGRRFDLIIAPYRVFQALETDDQVQGMFRCVRGHLAASGRCVLSMFMPNRPPDELRAEWCTNEETIQFDREIDGERIVVSDRRPRLEPEKLILYPELVHRRYRGDELVEEVVMPIAMRCWYPEQIRALVTDSGFRITGTWGGYAGEAFGEGPELLVEFALR